MADTGWLLPDVLIVAVALRIDELRRMGETQRDRTLREWADAAASVLSSRGDQLMFRTPSRTRRDPGRVDADGKASQGALRPDGTADTFNHLARGLAAAAYLPGGVTAFGRHWCTNHRLCLDAAAKAREVTSA
ncbi:MAG: hypothetical protein PHQ28_03420 [Mycobacterium sp.]|nr:hypothetical protein [Mycobacterium sp.]